MQHAWSMKETVGSNKIRTRDLRLEIEFSLKWSLMKVVSHFKRTHLWLLDQDFKLAQYCLVMPASIVKL